jgi:tRNA 2-thiouridine synthesizing protein A
MSDSDLTLDAMGLDCPLPLLKAKQALNTLTTGQTLRVFASDQGSLRDFAVFAEQSGNTLLECETLADHHYSFLLLKN